jgi:hypothetical protein
MPTVNIKIGATDGEIYSTDEARSESWGVVVVFAVYVCLSTVILLTGWVGRQTFSVLSVARLQGLSLSSY